MLCFSEKNVIYLRKTIILIISCSFMKLLPLFFAILLLGVHSAQASSETGQRRYIRFTEKISNNSSTFENQGLPFKSERLSSSGGNIEVNFDETLPDSIKTAIIAAKKLWESKLHNKQPIVINVVFEALEEDIGMSAEVGYNYTSDFKSIPSALQAQIVDNSYGSIDSPDGWISLNPDINWNCSFSKNAASDYNLPTMILKGIARCLGFGSCITEEKENQFANYWEYPIDFDGLLHYNGKSLNDIAGLSQEMTDAVTSDNVYAHTETQQYKIYAPKQFKPDLSLRYFDDENSLMSAYLGKGNVSLNVDNKTIDILNAIGWDLPISDIRIQCDNISGDGIGSCNEAHTFSLLRNGENITSYAWRFLLKDKKGDFIQIKTGTTETFTISRIDNPEDYFVNINGDLEGLIECDYALEGLQNSADPFSLSLEQKPTILSVDNIRIVSKDQYAFSLLLDVRYTGADYLYVEIEEEYDSSLQNYRFDEPYIAHVKTGNISNLYYSWVTILAVNKYGETSETIEFEPTYGARAEQASERRISQTSDITQIKLYDLNGNIIFDGSPNDFKNTIVEPGFYIKEEIYDDGTSHKTKISFK